MRQLRRLLQRGLRRRLRRSSRETPTVNPNLGLCAGLSVERFFAVLDERGIRYLVLRWFNELPYVSPDGDLDLLVHDDDLTAITDLLDDDSQSVSCDVFSVSGLPGTTYYGLPYLPPDKAARMLARARRFKSLCMVPSAEDHFLSFAYHAIYQKGLRSGLPTSEPGLTPNATPKHDYAGELRRLARRLGIEVDINMESFDEYLGNLGWRPAPAVMAKLALHNPWLAAQQRTRSYT